MASISKIEFTILHIHGAMSASRSMRLRTRGVTTGTFAGVERLPLSHTDLDLAEYHRLFSYGGHCENSRHVSPIYLFIQTIIIFAFPLGA